MGSSCVDGRIRFIPVRCIFDKPTLTSRLTHPFLPQVMFARHVEFNNVRALPNASLSAVASAASVLLEFRLRQSKKSQMAESAAKVRSCNRA
jgi:hypothetical protein